MNTTDRTTNTDTTIDRVLLWMVSGLSGADLETACVAKLDVDPAQVKAVVAEARKRLTLAAEYNRDELLGTALTRLNDLYSRCIRTGGDGTGPNLAKALDVQRELNRLTGLYRQPSLSGLDTGSTSEADDELAAVGEHLFPLCLTSDAYPLREHARLAAQRIAELDAIASQGATSQNTATQHTLPSTAAVPLHDTLPPSAGVPSHNALPKTAVVKERSE